MTIIDKVVKLAEQLIECNTVAGNTEENIKAINLIKQVLSEFNIEEFERNGHRSILIHNQPKGHRKFELILNGHLDIIPVNNAAQLSPERKRGRLYGAGVMDMKSNVAAMVYAFKNKVNKTSKPIALQLVTDEETGGFDGTGLQVEEGVRATFIISGEATGLDIENKTKGIVWADFVSGGKSAHGAYPWKGSNAIENIKRVMSEIATVFPNPDEDRWVTTYNLSQISSTNSAYNKIPSNCRLKVDLRYTPSDSEAIEGILDAIAKKTKCTIDIIVNEPAVNTPVDNPYARKLAELTKIKSPIHGEFRSANGSSDLRHFARVGCMGVEFGPIGGGMGSDKEWVDLKSLETFYEVLSDLLS